ncbi:MAG: glycoside hydrolase family protein, partial [Bacteroidetes bacterium]|nr:glycoside hydrolase family protein [Bacteroidota bacterium]
MKTLSILCAAVLLSGLAPAQSYLPLRNDSTMKIPPEIRMKAYAFDLRDVTLLEGSPFKHAMEKDAAYLLQLDPDRL